MTTLSQPTLRDIVVEYVEARNAYEDAIKPKGGFGLQQHLKPNDPVVARYREARHGLAVAYAQADYSAPSPRAQALEDAARVCDEEAAKRTKQYEGWAKDDVMQRERFRVAAQMATQVAAAIRALSSQSPSDGCKAYVAEMKTSSGIDYFVMVKSGERELSIRRYEQKHHADYEAAEYNWLFNGGEKPDILEYRPVSDGSSILPASPEVSG